MRQYRNTDIGWDYDLVFDQALKDGWIGVIFEKYPEQYRSELSLNGYDQKRIKSVFKDMFLDMVRYGNCSVYIDSENGGSHNFSTGSSAGKENLINYIVS